MLQMKPWLKTALRNHPIHVSEMIKELQRATRMLQTICGEAKTRKMATVANLVPAAKKSLEKFIFVVKVLLHEAKQQDTFWLGNLKNKDLQGKVLPDVIESDSDHDDEAQTQDDE